MDRLIELVVIAALAVLTVFIILFVILFVVRKRKKTGKYIDSIVESIRRQKKAGSC